MWGGLPVYPHVVYLEKRHVPELSQEARLGEAHLVRPASRMARRAARLMVSQDVARRELP